MKVTVGIAAYNAEKNIKHLLDAIKMQRGRDVNIVETIVHSDMSTDNTINIVKKNSSKKVKVINSKMRKGFAGSLVSILHHSLGEIIVVLNDDIKITDTLFIQKIIQPYLKNKKVGMISGNAIPFKGKGFVDRAVYTSFQAYNPVRYSIKNGNNHFTCDGKTLVFSRGFINSIKFPNDKSKMGNVDGYMYFLCITSGFLYRHVKTATSYWKAPRTVRDYVKWTRRNNQDYFILKKTFGKIVDSEYKKTSATYIKSTLKQSIKNPLGAVFLLITKLIVLSQIKLLTKTNVMWDSVLTTKEL